jgi:hypothetical protein
LLFCESLSEVDSFEGISSISALEAEERPSFEIASLLYD